MAKQAQDQPQERRFSRRSLLTLGAEGAKAGLALGLYGAIDPSVSHLLSAYQSGRRIANTLQEMGMGNEAQQELSRLEQQLQAADETLSQRSAEYQALHEKKRGVLEGLASIYEQNETFIRQAVTISRQMETLLGDLGNAGEAAKTDLWRRLDDEIIDLANRLGLTEHDSESARRRHEEINRYHQALREAYTNNENMQRTVTDFLTYLRDESRRAGDQIHVVDENFSNLTRNLRENYAQMHELEDTGVQATQRMEPQVAQLRAQIEQIHAELADDGVQMRPLQSGQEITGYPYLDRALASTYGRHALGTAAGMVVLTGIGAMAKAYLSPLTTGLAEVYALGKRLVGIQNSRRQQTPQQPHAPPAIPTEGDPL